MQAADEVARKSCRKTRNVVGFSWGKRLNVAAGVAEILKIPSVYVCIEDGINASCSSLVHEVKIMLRSAY